MATLQQSAHIIGRIALAVGASRRPHHGTTSADGIGSSPPGAHSAETRSVWLCAGHAQQLGGESPLCNLMEVKHE
jgi:hypothetical protein